MLLLESYFPSLLPAHTHFFFPSTSPSIKVSNVEVEDISEEYLHQFKYVYDDAKLDSVCVKDRW